MAKKVSSQCQLLGDAQVDKLADDAYVAAARDASAPLSKAEFLSWVEKGLKIDLSGDVSVGDVGKALGVFSEQEQQQKKLDSEAGKGKPVGAKSGASEGGANEEMKG